MNIAVMFVLEYFSYFVFDNIKTSVDKAYSNIYQFYLLSQECCTNLRLPHVYYDMLHKTIPYNKSEENKTDRTNIKTNIQMKVMDCVWCCLFVVT